MAEHEEVVIDGDSTEDDNDDDVCIITPESRKRRRRRRSNILMDQEEEEEEDGEEGREGDDAGAKMDDRVLGEAEKQRKKTEGTTGLSLVPRRQQQLSLGRGGVALQPMTLRTPTPTRRSRRHLQQLSISTAVAHGYRSRRQRQEEGKTDDGGDSFCIIEPLSAGAGTSRERSTCKGERVVIQKNDETPERARKEQQKLETKQSVEVTGASSSASRRSSRIQHKRLVKEVKLGRTRKLDYPVLDNCLDEPERSGSHYRELEQGEVAEPPLKIRRQSLPRERDHCEKVYADGGEDVDDFICNDDEIEYMEDDEEGVINVETSDDEMEDDPEEFTAMLAAGRSREIIEWFSIYLEYLEECIIDPDFETKMRRKRSKAKHQLYVQAVDRIERKLCACRDTVRSGVAWPEDMVDALKHALQFRSSHLSAERDCDACNRRQHVATYHVEFAGSACDATKLYRHDWMRHLKETVLDAPSVRTAFEMGSVCHARTLAYWQLLHAKQFWCVLVDAKLKECADMTGRIAQPYRTDFFTREFGRYKRLMSVVDKFAEDSKRVSIVMSNVWKRITARNVTSDFLSSPTRAPSERKSGSRRGTLDAFVAESEEEGADDEETAMEKVEEERRRAVAGGRNDVDQATDDEEEGAIKGSPLQAPDKAGKKEQDHQLSSPIGEVKKEHLFKEKDIDDLMCLMCDASPRNAGVVHGLYLHVYCCYACAKRQHRMKSGCMVCDRPIDRVLRLLPLTLDARNAIRNQKKLQI
ncbi:unnamed protein product [Hyaloperonospora brassicae]|uniref:DUF4211 domain-containing protein n=1 Tax=Hyaloperonospora brassicae TaxID=162125 RepID=A0AAV0U8E1_HYABA|nr:unnamed protein product [Hyaloperonospora brassicae]